VLCTGLVLCGSMYMLHDPHNSFSYLSASDQMGVPLKVGLPSSPLLKISLFPDGISRLARRICGLCYIWSSLMRSESVGGVYSWPL
jgi:hypothetical protein